MEAAKAKWSNMLAMLDIPAAWDGSSEEAWFSDSARTANTLIPTQYFELCIVLFGRFRHLGIPPTEALYVANNRARPKVVNSMVNAFKGFKAEMTAAGIELPEGLIDMSSSVFGAKVPSAACVDGGAKLAVLQLCMHGMSSPMQIVMGTSPRIPAMESTLRGRVASTDSARGAQPLQLPSAPTQGSTINPPPAKKQRPDTGSTQKAVVIDDDDVFEAQGDAASSLALYGLFQGQSGSTATDTQASTPRVARASGIKTEIELPRPKTQGIKIEPAALQGLTRETGNTSLTQGPVVSVSTGPAAPKGGDDTRSMAPSLVPAITPEAVGTNALVGIPHYMFYKKYRSLARRDPYMAAHIASTQHVTQTNESLKAALRPIYTAVGARDWQRVARGVDCVLTCFGNNLLDTAKLIELLRQLARGQFVQHIEHFLKLVKLEHCEID